MKKNSINTKFSPKIDDDVAQRLGARIADERYAHSFYTAASEWCKKANLYKAANFLLAESEAELEHEKMVSNYVTKCNADPMIPEKTANFSFSSLGDIVHKSFNMELQMFNSYITDSYDVFQRDIKTFEFLTQLRTIQIDSVMKFSDILHGLRMTDANVKNLSHFENTYFDKIA